MGGKGHPKTGGKVAGFNDSVQLTVRMDRTMRDLFFGITKRKGTTASDVVRQVMERYIERYGTEEEIEALEESNAQIETR